MFQGIVDRACTGDAADLEAGVAKEGAGIDTAIVGEEQPVPLRDLADERGGTEALQDHWNVQIVSYQNGLAKPLEFVLVDELRRQSFGRPSNSPNRFLLVFVGEAWANKMWIPR